MMTHIAFGEDFGLGNPFSHTEFLHLGISPWFLTTKLVTGEQQHLQPIHRIELLEQVVVGGGVTTARGYIAAQHHFPLELTELDILTTGILTNRGQAAVG